MSTQSTPFIVGFYDPDIQRKDPSGRSLQKILKFSDDQLEYYHDYIQTLFPLPEPSRIIPYAPLITPEVRQAFTTKVELRNQLFQAFERMLAFYGFVVTHALDGTHIRIEPAKDFKDAANASWRKRFDHNHLRITRIIRSLRVLGLEEEARTFFLALIENDGRERVSAKSRMFWKRAAERPLHLPPEEDDGQAEGLRWLTEDAEEGVETTEEDEGVGFKDDDGTATVSKSLGGGGAGDEAKGPQANETGSSDSRDKDEVAIAENSQGAEKSQGAEMVEPGTEDPKVKNTEMHNPTIQVPGVGEPEANTTKSKDDHATER